MQLQKTDLAAACIKCDAQRCDASVKSTDMTASGPAAGDPKRDCCIRIKAQAQTRVAGGATKGLIPIGYLGSQWRNGQYFLPPGYANRPTPVMVVLHGAGDWGVSMVTAFQQLAVKYR